MSVPFGFRTGPLGLPIEQAASTLADAFAEAWIREASFALHNGWPDFADLSLARAPASGCSPRWSG